MRSALSLLFCWAFAQSALAQLPPMCQIPNPPLAKTCATACILCELDGYSSTTTQTTPGQTIPGYCTFVVHSMGYIGFVAGSTNLTFEVTVGACTQGNSIEMGMYQTDDCQTFTLVSECNTEMFTNTTYSFTNTEPLHPGCPYFLAFDNNGPAACAFTVNVISGSAAAPAVAQPEVPDGPSAVCPGTTAVYTIPPIDGACHYRWTAPPGTTINGLPSPLTLNHDEGTTVTVTWGNTGGQLCVSGRNPCNNGPSACLPVTVAPIPPTVLPPATICNSESYEWLDGNAYTTTQLLTYTYVTPEGCDSIVRQQLNVRPPIVTPLGVLRICAGTCLQVGNNPYCASGSFSEVLTSEAGCDSTLFFIIVVVPVDAQIAAPDSINCLQPTTLLDGTGSIGDQYAWFNSSGTNISTDTTVLVSDTGRVTLVVTRVFPGLTCRDTATVIVLGDITPPDLAATGDTLTCTQPQGLISGTSATPGVSFLWTGPNGFVGTRPDTAVSIPGLYLLTATANNGCTALDTALVISDILPPVITASLPDTLTCLRDSVFLQTNTSPMGATLAWAGPQNFASAEDTVAVFVPGNYTLTATMPNGCADTLAVAVFSDTLAPQVTATGGTITCLSASVGLSGQVFPATSAVAWSGPNGFSATMPDTATTQPGHYLFTATSANGCTAAAAVLVAADTTAPQLIVPAADTLTCSQDTVLVAVTVLPASAVLVWTGPLAFASNAPTVALSVPGLYTATATSANGCTAQGTALVVSDTLPPAITASQPDTLTCLRDSVFLQTNTTPAGATLTWAGPNNFTSDLGMVAVFAPGNYTLTAVLSNGCADTLGIAVFSDTLAPQVSASGGTITCSLPTVGLSGQVVPAWVSVTWSGPNGFTSNLLDTTTTRPGQYLMTATAANGCTAAAAILVAADTMAPQLSVPAADTLTCTRDTVLVAVTVLPTGTALTWVGPQGFASSVPTVALSVPGQYGLIATAANGCTATSTVSVASNTLPPQVNASGGTLTCLQTSLTLQASISPAGSGANWSGPGTFSSTALNPAVVQPGLYTLTATGLNGCTATATATVLADASIPVVNAGGGVLTCAQTSVLLSGMVSPAGTPVQWSGPLGFSSNQISPVVAVAGTYTITATTVSGCTATAIATVSADTILPSLTVTGGTISCNQPSIGLLANPSPASAAIAWSGPASFFSNLTNPVTAIPGSYTVVATLPNGCTRQATAAVLADTARPTLTLGGGVLTCSKPVLNLSAVIAPAGSMVQWMGPLGFSSNLTNPPVSVSGPYSATATAPNGCTTTANVQVTADILPPTITATGNTLTCASPAVAVQAVAAAGSALLWAGPQNFMSTVPAPIVMVAGTYTVTATGANGCTATATAAIGTDTVAPQVNASGGLLTCLQPQLTLTATVQPVNASLSWTGPQSFTSSLLQPVVSVAGTYTLLATAANGCTSTAQATVTADTGFPQVSVTGGTLTCAQPALTLMPVFSPPGSSVAWSGPQNFTSNLPNPAVTAPGTYTITVTTGAGCTATSQTVVLLDTVPPAVTASGGTLTCAQQVISLSANVVPGGGPVTWQGPNGFSSTVLTPAVSVAGQYQVTATAPNGCTASAVAAVLTNTTPPQVTASGGVLTCLQPAISLSSTVSPAGSVLKWSGPQNFTSNLPNPVVTLAGMYTLTATAANGCTATATANVSADVSLPQPVATGGTVSCAQPQVQLSASVSPVGGTLVWSGPQGFSSALPNPTASIPGLYTLTATLPNGCSNTATATVAADTVRPLVTATGGDLTCVRETVILKAIATPANSAFAWSGPSDFSSALAMPEVSVDGNYAVTVTATNGCTAVGQTVVTAHNQPTWALSLGPDLHVEQMDWVFPKPESDLPAGQMAGVRWTFPAGAIGSPCDSCLNTAFRIVETGELSVIITDKYGCSQTASVLISVRQPIYAPNAFSPESDAGNHLFALFPGAESLVSRLRIFRIYDRWGTLVHERLGADPSPEAHGWDGVVRGLKARPGVYVWYAEIELEDGRVLTMKGDVTLVR
ncbi:MAG: hypothetical protein ACKVU2_06365 [Saprospiraceae bacterium]